MFHRLIAACPLLLSSLLPAQEPPGWEALDARPLPQWFQDAQFGIFIHWGVYSVPAICDTSTYSEWYQHWLDTNSHDGLVRKFHERVYGADFAYRDFAPQFRAELFDPAQWAATFRRAGADYIVITSKHHDGFCLWPDAHTQRVRGHPWNAVDTGPRRDLLGDLAAAVRQEGIRFGLYYSFLEWHNPIFERSIPDYVEQQMFPQVHDLIARYRPDIFWPDGEWEHPDSTWRSRELLQWLRDNAPNRDELVVNDRWGKGCRGEHGDYYTTEYGGYGGTKTYLGHKPFEECRGIGHSFAFNRLEGYDVYLSRTECVRTLIDLVSRGGKLLLDIGPAADGTIPLIMVDRLLAIGRWLEENGAAIRGCTRSPFRTTPWGRATRDGEVVYLHVYDWPRDGALRVPGLASGVQRAWLLRDPDQRPLGVGRDRDGVLVVDLDAALPSEHATVVALQLQGELQLDERILATGADGAVELPAALARVTGTALRREPKGNLGYWSNTEDRATWAQVLLEPGRTYRVLADCAVQPGQEGGRLLVEVDGMRSELHLDSPTAGWQDYQRRVIGTFTAARPEVGVTVRAGEIPGQALCNLQALRLEPVGTPTGPEARDAAGAAAVRARCQQLCERLRTGDLDAVAAAYRDDAVLHGLGGEPVVGRAAIDAYWQRLRGVAKDWQLETHSIRVTGAVIHQLGRSTLTVERDGATSRSVVDFALTWQRDAAGELRIVSDVYWPVSR